MILAWRDIKVRYAQALFGMAWAVLQPVLMTVIFTVFLGRLAKLPSEGVPYPVFALTGLVVWTYFANAVSTAGESLVSNSNMVSKVYFPRAVVPAASLASWLPDLGISLLVLGAMMGIYQISPGPALILLPLFILLAVLTAASVALWVSALNVAYRDVRYGVPFLLQLGLFATPVAYPATLVSSRWRWLLGLNPMAGVVEGFRWTLLHTAAPPTGLLVLSAGVVLIVLMSGLVYFQRVEQSFPDVI